MQEYQISESFRLGAVLALAGGFLDAYSYLIRGGVFANAQTGNMVLLGIHLMERDWRHVLYYLVPIAAFVVGILAVELIKARMKYSARIHWRQLIVLLEAALLLPAAFLPAPECDMIANCAISLVCAMQVEAFRKVHGSAFATTMCTGNLRSGTEALYRFLHAGAQADLTKAVHYFGIILVFIAGAVIGGLLCGLLHVRAILIPCALLLAAALVMCREYK